MLSREQALDEARKQKEALAKIGGWRRFLFLLTASLLAVAVFGIRSGGPLFILGAAAAVAAAVSFLLTFIVDLSIRNGHRNVERIWTPSNKTYKGAFVLKEFTYTIKDELGIHARPAGLLSKLSKSFPETVVTVTKDGSTAKASQLMKLMNLGIKRGDQVTVAAEGAAEEEAAAALQKFFEENL